MDKVRKRQRAGYQLPLLLEVEVVQAVAALRWQALLLGRHLARGHTITSLRQPLRLWYWHLGSSHLTTPQNMPQYLTSH